MPTGHIIPSVAEFLDEFLLSEKAPENCMDLLELHGFLTGIAVGPELIPASEWLPVIWGEEVPEFDGEDEAKAVVSAIMLLYNEILHCLATDPDEFAPIVMKGPKGQMIADDWAHGFVQAMSVRRESWAALTEDEAGIALIPILYLGSDDDQIPPEFSSCLTADMIEQMPAQIADSVIAIDDFWRSRRVRRRPNDSPLRRIGKVGRNDPCPCGSGRKFKKCCGQQG
jgi:uncharacterized protein